jgi:hypothetical protein
MHHLCNVVRRRHGYHRYFSRQRKGAQLVQRSAFSFS